MIREWSDINTPLIMYFQGGRHVKKFHLKFHFLGGGWVCRGRTQESLSKLNNLLLK